MRRSGLGHAPILPYGVPMITIPRTDLTIYPLSLGGNVFGWTATKEESFKVLDRFAELGGNFIDTADAYSAWKEGNIGGESESIIGEWMESRGNRGEMIIATKVAKLATRSGLAPSNIASAAEDSLRRLRTDYIDLYYAHEDDEKVAQEEYLSAFNNLVKAGKVRYLGASNFSAERLKSAAEIAKENNLAPFVALQNHYNILERDEYETTMIPTLQELEISSIPYFGLARGFLTGKYRKGVTVDSVRAKGVENYQNDHGYETVDRLEKIAKEKSTSISSIALAWLRAQPTVIAPIASARTTEQLEEFTPVVGLSDYELAELSA
jgi:aryl-alcohol dehydrogenase-like predicted oxidoreductase